MSYQTKPSPGPWKWEDDGGGRGYLFDARGTEIIQEELDISAIGAADARLIASAPDLSAQVAVLTAENEQLRAEAANASAIIGTFTPGGPTYDELVREGDRLAAEVERLRARLAAEEQATRDATASMAYWQGKAHDYHGGLEEATKEIEKLKGEVAETRNFSLQMAGSADGLAMVAKQYQTETATLRAQLEEARREARGALTALECAQERAEKAERERGEWVHASQNNESLYRTANERAERLEAALRTIEKDFDCRETAHHQRHELHCYVCIAGAALSPAAAPGGGEPACAAWPLPQPHACDNVRHVQPAPGSLWTSRPGELPEGTTLRPSTEPPRQWPHPEPPSSAPAAAEAGRTNPYHKGLEDAIAVAARIDVSAANAIRALFFQHGTTKVEES